MALVGSRPSWQTAELSEEWPMSSPSSAAASSSSAREPDAPLRQHAASAAGSFRSVAGGDASREGSSSPGGAPGTFLVRDDVPDAALEGPLAKLRAAGGLGAGGADSPGSRSLFSPLRLESMFQPPSPPLQSQQQQGQGVGSSEMGSPLPEVILTPPPPVTVSTTPTRPPSGPSPTPSPSAPTPSPMPRSAQQLPPVGHRQLYHVPQVPSRLQKTFTPADLTASTIDPAIDDDDVNAAGNDDDGETGAVTLERSDMVLPGLRTSLARSGVHERNWPATFEFECRPAGSTAPSAGHDSFGSFGPMPAAHSTPADRSRASSRSGITGATPQEQPSPTTLTRLSLHTSHARDHGPARTAPSSTASSAPGAPTAGVDAGARKLNLFRPTYDTFTRDFMSAIVDTIEGSPSSTSSSSTADGGGKGSGLAFVPAGPSAGSRIFSDRDVAVDFRDAKRIRLASAAGSASNAGGAHRAVSGSTASSSFERLRRSKVSLSSSAATGSASGVVNPGRAAHGSRPSRDWDGEARELMQRVKELGRSAATSGRPSAAVADPPLVNAGVIGARVLSGSSGEGRGWGQGLALSSTDGSEDGRNEAEVEGRGIEPITELPEGEAASPQGTEIRNYRLPSQTRTAAAISSAPAPPASRRAYPSTSGKDAGRRRQTDLPASAPSGATSALPTRSHLTANADDLAGDEKENAPPSSAAVGEGFGHLRQKRQSPRKLLRRLSAADEVEKELDGAKSPLKRSQSTRPPPAPSSGAAGVVPTSDLSRYVSSSTGPPPSTFGISTVSSYTKHVGPPVGRSTGSTATKLTNIPYEPSSEPLRVGKLEFDRERSKWVRARPGGHARVGSFGSSGLASEEDDPFKDFNSTTTSGRAPAAGGNLIEQLRASSTTPPVDEAGPSRPFTRDASRSLSLPRSFERSLSISSNAGGDGFDMDEVAASLKSFQFPSSSSSESLSLSPPPKARPPPLQHHNSAPLPAVASTPLPATQQRTRVASTGGLRPCLTPVSVLKKRSPGVGFRDSATETPGSNVHRRSVSFSDGKKAGKIDLQVTRIEFSLAAAGTGRHGRADVNPADRSSQPSARAVRIQSMLDGLGDDEVTESMASLAEQTPSKGGSSLRHYKPRDPPRAAAVATQPAEYDDETEDSTFAGNLTVRSVAAGRSFHYGGRRGNPGDATFLTECSFDGVRDRLVEIITDVHPYVAYWEGLRELNLEGRLAGSVARLKEFLPKLVEVNLNRNDLSYLSGLPASVETLHAAHNRLSELTAVAHLSNLRFLNIGYNQLEAVNQLDCLQNLTELVVDSNSITDISPLFGLTKLVNLSAKGNGIASIDVTKAQWSQLASLDLSGNKLTEVLGLERLETLSSLTLDENRMCYFQPAAPLVSLQTLKVSSNRLRRLDVRDFPQLRTLYADGNELESINPTGGPTRLQTLSARSQAGTALVVTGRELRHVKRLFLSGNALSPSLFAQPCPELAYLELASCKLTSLPNAFATFAPALKSLNLNYNYLGDLSALADLRRLRKLSVVGSRLEASTPVVRLLQTLPALEMLDLRMNPFTLAMYLPLIVSGLNSTSSTANPGSSALTAPIGGLGSTAPPPSETLDPAPTAGGGGASWAELDGAFRRALPDEWYVRRLAHRGLVMRACPRTTTIDGVGVEFGERRKADELLATLEARRRAL